MLEDLGPLNLAGIHWVIVGGESGPGWRPMQARIQQQFQQSGVAFFFKQWDCLRPKKKGRLLNGQTYDEYPPMTSIAVPGRDQRLEMQKLVGEAAKSGRWSCRSWLAASLIHPSIVPQ